MHKNRAENFAGQKRTKTAKRTRNRPKRAKPGAFWVLEGMRTVKGRCKRMGKTGKLGENQGTNLSRLPPRSALDGRHRRPAPHDTHRRRACVRTSLPNPTAHYRKSQVPQKRYLTFLAGAEGLGLACRFGRRLTAATGGQRPSARGFGVDVGEHNGEQKRAGVARFFPQVTK